MMEPQNPIDYMSWTNPKGYTLEQSLNTMLKKWQDRDPNWQVDDGIYKQSKIYGMTVKQIHDGIRAHPTLSKKFLAYPASGYKG